MAQTMFQRVRAIPGAGDSSGMGNRPPLLARPGGMRPPDSDGADPRMLARLGQMSGGPIAKPAVDPNYKPYAKPLGDPNARELPMRPGGIRPYESMKPPMGTDLPAPTGGVMPTDRPKLRPYVNGRGMRGMVR